MTQRTSVALLSGGLDSATAAAMALEEGDRVIGLSFDYGQRHHRELEAAAAVASHLGWPSITALRLIWRPGAAPPSPTTPSPFPPMAFRKA